MSAKEKAEELVKKFGKYSFSTVDISQDKENAKDLALICVNEILLHEKINHSILDKSTDYWNEVKQQIELL
jgi:hypothetical protein